MDPHIKPYWMLELRLVRDPEQFSNESFFILNIELDRDPIWGLPYQASASLRAKHPTGTKVI